jgi:hypothetical protein
MSIIKQNCEEKGCSNLAKHNIHLALRSRPNVTEEISNPLGYVCDKHINQNINEFIPEELWQKMLITFKVQKKVLPVRCVSYLITTTYK